MILFDVQAQAHSYETVNFDDFIRACTVVFRAQVRVPCPTGVANEPVPRDSPIPSTCSEHVNGTNQKLMKIRRYPVDTNSASFWRRQGL